MNFTDKYFSKIDNIVLYLVITQFLLFISDYVGKFIIGFIPDNTNILKSFNQYFMFIGHWMVFLPYMYFIKNNRYILKKIWNDFKFKNINKIFYGFFVGFSLNAICVGAAVLNGDIKLTFVEFNPFILLLILFAVFIQAFSEEICVRGLLYHKILNRYGNYYYAIFVTAIYFAFIHCLVPRIDIITYFVIFLFGIFTAFSMKTFDSFSFVVAVHTAWNFCENIIFGIPISGIKADYSVFRLIYETKENSFVYSINTNLEGTWFAVVLFITSIYWVNIHNKYKR